MGVRLNLTPTIIRESEDTDSELAGVDNAGLEVDAETPSLERKHYARTDTSLTQVDLDILSKQTNQVRIESLRPRPIPLRVESGVGEGRHHLSFFTFGSKNHIVIFLSPYYFDSFFE